MQLVRRFCVVLLLTAMAAACSSGGGDEAGGSAAGASAGEPSGVTSATAANVIAGHTDACALVNADEAAVTLEGEVEAVEDPTGEGLVTPPDIGELRSVCYYRPSPDDGGSFVATALFEPGSVPDATLEQATQEGTLITKGPNYEVYDVDGSIVVHEEDQVLLVVATTDPDSSFDRDAGLKLGLLAAARLPASDATPDNHACELLTPEIVAGALDGIDLIFGGGQVLDETRSGCEFAGAEAWKVVDLLEYHGEDVAQAFLDAKENAGSHSPISDLGDEAFDSGFAGVWVRSGEQMLQVIVTTTDGVRDADLETEVARQVVEAM